MGSKNIRNSASSNENPLTGANLVPLRHFAPSMQRPDHFHQKLVFSCLGPRSSSDCPASNFIPAKNTVDLSLSRGNFDLNFPGDGIDLNLNLGSFNAMASRRDGNVVRPNSRNVLSFQTAEPLG